MLIPLESFLSECWTSPVLRFQPQGCRSALPSPGHFMSCCSDPSWGEKELQKDTKSLTDTATAFSQGYKTQSCLGSDGAQWAKRGVCGKVTSALTFKIQCFKKPPKSQLSSLIFNKLNKEEKATQILHLNLSSTVVADGTQAQLCLCFETYCTLSVAFVDFNYSKLKRMTSKTRDFDMTMIRFAKTSFKIFRYISYHRQ